MAAKKKSSLIEGIQNISYRKELFVRFTSGELYAYFDVPHDLVSEFKKAESLGKFFLTKIKNDFAYQKIDV